MMTQESERLLEPFRQYLSVLAELHLDRKLRGKLDASDIVQQTFVRAYSALADVRTEGLVGCRMVEELFLMSAIIEAPIEMVEAVAALRLPPRGDRRLQILMDRNTNGAMTPEQKEELEDLVELGETFSLVRAQGLHVLGRTPA